MPKTKLGKWSLGLILVMPFIFMIGARVASTMYLTVPSGRTIIADIASRPALALTMLVGFAFGITAFITGLVAIIMQKERVFLVFASTLVGATVILFLLGEVLDPH
jgi:hypothetical protein